jgi:hypothetical protein
MTSDSHFNYDTHMRHMHDTLPFTTEALKEQDRQADSQFLSSQPTPPPDKKKR